MQGKIELLKKKTIEIRRLIIEMLAKAKSGHPGGSLSSVEIITTLYFHILRHNPKDPSWIERDRFHLSKGHACPTLYAALALNGYFDIEELWHLRRLGALLQGHSDRRVPGIEVSSGSLGQGLSVALGMALALRLDNLPSRVYCLMGDGEIQEGNIWEAAMAAAHYKLDNLCGIIDYNRFQIDGRVEEVMGIEPLKEKWIAFNWDVQECDGHNIEELIKVFERAKMVKGKPSMIIAHTVKGKGVSFMEHVVDFHGRAPTEEERKIALDELEKLNNKD